MDFDINKFIKLMKPFVDQTYTTKKSVVDGMFYQPGTKSSDWDFGALDRVGKDILLELNKYYVLPKELIYLYLGLKTAHEDLVYEGFSFMSLNTIDKNNKEQYDAGQTIFLDIGMCYAGMGYCFVLAWIREEQKFFFRMDGGANGYDVEYNYNKYIRNKIDFNECRKKLMSWEELKDFLMDDKEEDKFGKFHKVCIL